MKQTQLENEIESIFAMPDYHDPNTHQNYPTISMSYTKEGMKILIKRILALIDKHTKDIIGEDDKKNRDWLNMMHWKCRNQLRAEQRQALFNIHKKIKEL